MLATAAAIRCIVAAPPAAARAAPAPRGAWEEAASERGEAGYRAGSPAGSEADGAGEPH
ncbi:hypothetical protein IEQ11_10845 [Lysobacter capsici]|uniref:hypothetical protein n=1 Tax=Lysobacter capsici TaxID=435897 RepID=UPI0012FE5037|nr:hypothetical protein [Lysobacter capsici]UOF17089.1 hypothetical protein IEQ11_10845 [Lysobacter capsici]